MGPEIPGHGAKKYCVHFVYFHFFFNFMLIYTCVIPGVFKK